jgi:hypothetical protein
LPEDVEGKNLRANEADHRTSDPVRFARIAPAGFDGRLLACQGRKGGQRKGCAAVRHRIYREWMQYTARRPAVAG